MFIHSSIYWHSGCFPILVMVNNAAIDIKVHISFRITVFFFFKWIHRSRRGGLYGSSIFNFFSPVYTVFNSGCANLHSHLFSSSRTFVMSYQKDKKLRTKLVDMMEFQLSYFKSWKMMLWKCCTQYASTLGKLSSGHRTGKGQFSFQSQRKAGPKNAQTTTQ